MANIKLTKYELVDEGKALLQAHTEQSPKSIVILQNSQTGDPHISIQVDQLTDYLAKMIFERKDGKGKRYVKPLSGSKAAHSPPTGEKGK